MELSVSLRQAGLRQGWTVGCTSMYVLENDDEVAQILKSTIECVNKVKFVNLISV